MSNRLFTRATTFLLVSAILITSTTACATLFGAKSADVDLNSNPSGAKIYVNGEMMGTTPLNINLSKDQNYSIQFKKPGYTTRTYKINKGVGAGWVVLDVLGGVIPVVIDAATGSWYKLDRYKVNGVLQQEQSATNQ